jgi:hypothetical protein
MLDAFIIEEIRRRERAKEERDRPRVEVPVPTPDDSRKRKSDNDGEQRPTRQVVIIDLARGAGSPIEVPAKEPGRLR